MVRRHLSTLLSVLRAVWVGATEVSVATSLGPIVFALLEFVIAAIVVRPARLARLDPSYLRASRFDERVATSVEALRLKSQASRTSVVYVGASNARMALPHAGAEMADAVAAAAGRPVAFHFLHGDNLSVAEWVVCLDQLPVDFHGVVALSIFDDLETLHGERDVDVRDRLALDSPTLERLDDALVAAIGDHGRPRATGVFFVDHLEFFVARRAALARAGPAAGREEDPWRPGRRPKIGAAAATRARQDRDPPALALLPFIERVTGPLRARGIDVVLVEAPSNPAFDALKPQRRDRSRVYEPAMLQFAGRTGVRYWNPSAEAHLSPEDFVDEVHLRAPEARERFARVLVDRLGRVLRGEPVEDRP